MVKTDEKKDARIFAFSLSVVADDLILLSMYVRFHIMEFVLVLDWI